MSAMSLKMCTATAVAALSLGACQMSHAEESSASDPARSMTLSYEAGQMITLAAPVIRAGDEGAQARREYFERVNPIALPLGLSRDGALSIRETVTGSFTPNALSFFSWPSAEAESQLYAHEDWTDIKAMRPEAWDYLRLYSVELEEDLELTFSEDKAYSVAVAWINPDHPDSYESYLDAIEPTLTEMGARYIYKMEAPRFEQHATPGGDPGQITFVEWQSPEDLERFLNGRAFAQVASTLTEGVTRFEVHLVAPVFPSQ